MVKSYYVIKFNLHIDQNWYFSLMRTGLEREAHIIYIKHTKKKKKNSNKKKKEGAEMKIIYHWH